MPTFEPTGLEEGFTISHTHGLFEEDPRIDIVRILGRRSQPLSIAEMHDELVDLGHPDVSFSTVARRLKEIEQLGLCRQTGREGRVLTAEGKATYVLLLEHQTRLELLAEVRNISTSEGLEQLLRMRRAVEPEGAYEFALHASDADIEQLRRLQADYQGIVEVGGSHPRGTALDFHRFIASRSTNPLVRLVLNEALHTKLDHVEAAMDAVLQQQHVHESSVDFHDALIEAFAARDAQAAERHMRGHLESMLTEFEQIRPKSEMNVLNSILEWSKSAST